MWVTLHLWKLYNDNNNNNNNNNDLLTVFLHLSYKLKTKYLHNVTKKANHLHNALKLC